MRWHFLRHRDSTAYYSDLAYRGQEYDVCSGPYPGKGSQGSVLVTVEQRQQILSSPSLTEPISMRRASQPSLGLHMAPDMLSFLVIRGGPSRRMPRAAPLRRTVRSETLRNGRPLRPNGTHNQRHQYTIKIYTSKYPKSGTSTMLVRLNKIIQYITLQ